MKDLSNPTIAALLCLTTVLSATPSSAQLELRTNRSLAEALSEQPEPLPLKQAFPFFVSTISPGKYRVTWEPASGHYLYQHAFSFAQTVAETTEEIEVEYSLPAGLNKSDKFFGDIVAGVVAVSTFARVLHTRVASRQFEDQFNFVHPALVSFVPIVKLLVGGCAFATHQAVLKIVIVAVVVGSAKGRSNIEEDASHATDVRRGH